MIDFFLDNFGWFLLSFIILRVLFWLFGEIGAGMKSESAKPPADTAKPPASTRGKRKGGAKIPSRSGDIRSSFQDINIRFEKVVNMATDSTNQMQREMGFAALGQMFSSNGENFDALTEENQGILEYLLLNNFKMAGDIRSSFQKLYEGCRVRYSEEYHNLSESLYDKTHRPDIDIVALNLWKGIVNWKMRKINGEPVINFDPVVGIFATQASHPRTHSFIFSGISLSGINFLVKDDGGMINFSSQSARANFRGSCFLQVEMQGADVSYVDFSHSHLSRVNCISEGEDCNMECVGTIFDFANLIDCNFGEADFKDASFIGTNITGSDFSWAKNLTKGQFKNAAHWIRPGKPQFPKGWTEDFVNSLARDAQDEEGRG